jgi:hypothetical protein
MVYLSDQLIIVILDTMPAATAKEKIPLHIVILNARKRREESILCFCF